MGLIYVALFNILVVMDRPDRKVTHCNGHSGFSAMFVGQSIV